MADNATFRWQVEDNQIWFHIRGWDWGEDWIVLEQLRVLVFRNGRVLLELQHDHDILEENPEEYDEASRANMRSLLRHLGYVRKPVWEWTEP
jgi:hypothetical protein